jgi:hypothetical protein
MLHKPEVLCKIKDAEIIRLCAERDTALEILSAGRLFRSDLTEEPTTLVERAKNVVTALAAETAGHNEVRQTLTETQRALAALVTATAPPSDLYAEMTAAEKALFQDLADICGFITDGFSVREFLAAVESQVHQDQEEALKLRGEIRGLLRVINSEKAP